jgi:P pilus assembly chaperone PapD
MTCHPMLSLPACRVLLCAAALGLAPAGAMAQGKAGAGDLLVAPTRVVLEGRKRAVELTLINTGSQAATYRISFVQIRMDENGGTREVQSPGPGEQFADSLIRYSPRQVLLEPNVAQTVRLQLRKPADLAPGEYRSHLLFRAVPPAEPIHSSAEPSGAAPQALTIKLTPIYGVSIPVIVRHGDTSVSVALSNLELLPPSEQDPTPVLHLQMSRTGNQSAYGDFTVTFLPASGQAVVVGQVTGVAVYTPNTVRHAGIALRVPPGTNLRAGVLRVTYSVSGKRNETVAEAELRLP